MKVSVAALLGARNIVGWSQKEIIFGGGTVEELLGSITTASGGTLKDVLVQPDGTPNPKYQFAVNQQIIDKEALSMAVNEGDRLVIMDRLHLPSLTC
ncbi:MAG TPA: MoaD/ThiS family protein [Thermodesulfobacteriota bacterium]|nr:MoaD/ThiS family protein [Deltaproteobacteria bacterium]HNU70483.1 MoaD/ThiS family protein [Thermodesulfobacteriota bacterium]HOC39346.1 MoaD/ThiS family protein [Thermodesulfobacteriota bacterium]HQO76999.1 MoaD/ThiS family protein [Thermodesulfobacteriota bacterium]